MAVPAGFVIVRPEDQGQIDSPPQAANNTSLPEGFVIQQPKVKPVVDKPAEFQSPQERLKEIRYLLPRVPSSQVVELAKERDRLIHLTNTRATKELPEIGSGLGVSDFLPDLSTGKTALISTALLSATDPEEMAQILKNASPDVGIQQDEGGNIIAVNNKTGQRTVVNKPGLSGLDVMQTVGRIAAFTPAGRVTGPIKTGLAAAATEAGLQGIESAAGGEFDASSVSTEGVVTTAIGLATPKIFRYGKPNARQRAILKELKENPRNPNFAKFTVVKGKPVQTRQLKEAVRQFGSPEAIAVAKAASPADKQKIKKMLNIIKQGKKDPLFKDANRVGDVVGDSLAKRIRTVKGVLNRSGKQIDNVVRNELKGKTVNVQQAKANFADTLAKLRVNYDPVTGAVDFAGSALEGQGGGTARDLIQRTALRLRRNVQKAEDVHFAKRLIDQKTAFGTREGGLEGEIGRAIKKLRTDLNDSLRAEFPNYKRANQKYSEAINALDKFQDAAGSKLDLDNLAALGTKARSFTNNTQTRARLTEALDDIDSVLSKNKIFFKDDIATQVNIANALERRFKTEGATTFKSKIVEAGQDVLERGSTRPLVERAIEGAAQKIRPVSDDLAIEAFLQILE